MVYGTVQYSVFVCNRQPWFNMFLLSFWYKSHLRGEIQVISLLVTLPVKVFLIKFLLFDTYFWEEQLCNFESLKSLYIALHLRAFISSSVSVAKYRQCTVCCTCITVQFLPYKRKRCRVWQEFTSRLSQIIFCLW